jgi:hypothetical protein
MPNSAIPLDNGDAQDGSWDAMCRSTSFIV